MYVKHTFLTKANTIVRNEKANLSLNPVMELSYGGRVTRGLIHFNIAKLKELCSEKVYADNTKLKHTLKMFNTGSVSCPQEGPCDPIQPSHGNMERATSFDLVFFKIPEVWDDGKGFDYDQDVFCGKHRGYSEFASNWFNSKTETPWSAYVYEHTDGPKQGSSYTSTNTYCTFSESPYYDGEVSTNPDVFRIQLNAYCETFSPETGKTYTEKASFPSPIVCTDEEWIKVAIPLSEFVTVESVETYSYYLVKTVNEGVTRYYKWNGTEYVELTASGDFYRFYTKQYAYYEKLLEPTPGIYSPEKIEHEIEKFSANASSIVIGMQHFEFGNEDVELDITATVNAWIAESTSTNFGIGIAFIPSLESIKTDRTQYVGFFTNHTNSFFEPYVETTYNDRIIDDRANCYLNKTNRLYFHSIIGGKHVNLGALPSCSINNVSKTVYQATKGVYYVNVDMPEHSQSSPNGYYPDTMYYDVWSGIVYGQRTLPNVEKFFTTKRPSGYYNFSCETSDDEYRKIVPNVYGIDNGSVLNRDSVVKVGIEYVIRYTRKQQAGTYDSEYRLYAMQGNREITVIDWQPVNCDYITSHFYLDTESLLPGEYRLDIRCHDDFETDVFRNTLSFRIADNATYETK